MATEAIPAETTDRATATNADAVITYVAVVGVRHVLPAVYWSYFAAPAAGRLTVEDGAGVIIFDIDLDQSGPGAVYWEKPCLLAGSINTAMIITLYSGGVGIVGKVNTPTHTTQG